MSTFDGSCLGGIPGALILVIGLLDEENMFVTHDLGRVSASDIGSQRINPDKTLEGSLVTSPGVRL